MLTVYFGTIAMPRIVEHCQTLGIESNLGEVLMQPTERVPGIRIFGEDGDGLILNPVAFPADDGSRVLGVEISVLSSDRSITYLARRVTPGFAENLREYLLSVAVAGEYVADSFRDEAAGLEITIKPLTTMWAEVHVQIAQILDTPDSEFDWITFETSRESLSVAATAATNFGIDSSSEVSKSE